MAVRDLDINDYGITSEAKSGNDCPVVDWSRNEDKTLLLAAAPDSYKGQDRVKESFTRIENGVLTYTYPKTTEQALRASKQLDSALQSPFVKSLVIAGLPDNVVPRHFKDQNGYHFCFSDGQTSGPAHGYGPQLETIIYSGGLTQNLSKIRQAIDATYKPQAPFDTSSSQETNLGSTSLDGGSLGMLPSALNGILPLVDKITRLSEQNDIQRIKNDPQDPWPRLNYAQAKVVEATLPLFKELGGKVDQLQPVFDTLLNNRLNLTEQDLQDRLRNADIVISATTKQEAQADLQQALNSLAHPESLRQETRYEQLTTQMGTGYADPYSTTNMFAYLHPSATAFNTRRFMLWGDRLGGVLPNYSQSPSYITQSLAHQSGQEIERTRREITTLQKLVNCLPGY